MPSAGVPSAVPVLRVQPHRRERRLWYLCQVHGVPCAVHRCGYWIPLWISIRFIGTVMCGNSTSGARKRPRARSGSDLTPSILRCSKMGLQANSGVFLAGFHLSLSIARGLSNLYISMSSLLCKYLHREKNMYLTSRFIVFPGVNIFI